MRVQYVKKWFGINLISNLLLALMILAILGVPVYRSIYGMVRGQVLDAAQAGLDLVAQTIGGMCYNIDRAAYLSSEDAQLIPYLLEHDKYYASKAVGYLQRTLLLTGDVEEMALLYAPSRIIGGRKVYSSSGEWQANSYFAYARRYDQWDLTSMYEGISSCTESYMRPCEWVLVNGSERARYFTYVSPLKRSGTNTRGIMLCMIREEVIQSIFQLSDAAKHSLQLMLDGQSVLWASEQLAVAGSTLAQIGDGALAAALSGGAASMELDGRRYAVLYRRASYKQWTYVQIVPEDQIAAVVFDGTRSVFVYVYVGLIGAILLSAFFSSQLTRPVRRLASVARDLRPREDGRSLSELDEIENAMEYLAKDNTKLNDQLRSQRDVVRMYRIRKLFLGKVDETAELMRIFAEEGVAICTDPMRALVFRIDDEIDFERRADPSMQDLIRFGLIEMAQEQARGNGLVGIGCEFARGDHVALIVSGGELSAETTRALCERMCALAVQHFHFSLTTGVSARFSGLTALSEAYEEALSATESRFLAGGGRTHFIEACAREEELFALEDEQMRAEEKIVALLMADDYAHAGEALTEYLGLLRRGTPARARQHVALLALSLKQHARQKSLLEREGTREALDRLLAAEHELLSDAERDLRSLLHCFCEAARAIQSAQKARLVGSAMEYMEANLNDPSLSVDLIAAKLGVSTGYLSRYFKEQTGMSPMRYFEQIRMKQACALLRKTKLSLSEIMSACGYVDKASFIRKFKRLYAMTPMTYRQNTAYENASEEE